MAVGVGAVGGFVGGALAQWLIGEGARYLPVVVFFVFGWTVSSDPALPIESNTIATQIERIDTPDDHTLVINTVAGGGGGGPGGGEVPEPDTVVMLGTGLVITSLLLRKKVRRA